MKTYWVEYTYTYKYFGDTFGESGSCRVKCLKKNIPEELKERIVKEELDEYATDIKVNITDCYETSEYEI